MLPMNDGDDGPVDIASLNTDELLKLRKLLEESKNRTDQLLASLGI